MEVHAHSHTPRKKWTNYFWEFLMLFLAVFCGFLAEYKLEHVIEHQRENKFAALLYDDLKKDTAWLNRVVKIKKWRGGKLDSLVYYLSSTDFQNNADQIYYYSSFLDLDNFFLPNDATIQQLRNSGSLRYFSNLELYNTITLYYKDCAFYLEKEQQRKVRFPMELRSEIFDANSFSSLSDATPDIMDVVHYPTEKMHLLSGDKKIYNEFLHYITELQQENNVSILFLGSFITDDLIGLIREIKKEYRIK